MEIVIIAVVVVVAVVLLAMSPLTRRHGDVAQQEMDSIAPGANVNRQFDRPRNEGDLL